MIYETRSIDETIAFLNQLLLIDRQAISKLMETRVPCNQDMVDHESVQVALVPGTAPQEERLRVGLLGILNGLFGTFPDGPKKGWGLIVADVAAYCPACGLHGDAIEKAGWKQGDEYCPACAGLISWEYEKFRRMENV
jgi:hypothetical protein